MLVPMNRAQRQRTQLEQQLAHARTWEQWYTAAHDLDELDGNLAWREHSGSELIHEALLQDHTRALKTHREEGDSHGLIALLQESVYRHLGELANPALYSVARTGTKRVVTDFLAEVEQAMQSICDHPLPGVSDEQKLQMFRDAERVYGQPALMLSGGGAFGIYHLGVTRALWQQDLLPDVMAGSSMGAIVAGAICTRNAAELDRFFTEPQRIHRDAFHWLGLRAGWQRGYAMDPDQLHRHIRANMGSPSFREAFRHSGRTLNISVSPTRTRQKPRLLNALSSPEVLVDCAVLASCAVPGLYPPVTLKARKAGDAVTGEIPYMPTERWIDGSVHGDLPLMRMARLHNVNKTIVSQANPHVVPFISQDHQRGAAATLKRATVALVHGQIATALKLTRESPTSSIAIVRPLLEQAHAMATQSYLGDINIHLPFQPTLYRKVLSNPQAQDLENFITLGERATWPQLAMIRDQTRISRTFARCISHLKTRLGRRHPEPV